MTKNMFIKELQSKLGNLPQEELNKILHYYSELIDDKLEDNINEEDAVKSLGNIDDIVRDISNDNSIPKIMYDKVKSSYDKSDNKVIWIFLAIIGSPIWIPLLFALAAVIFAIVITVISLLFTLLLLLGSFYIVGVVSIIASFTLLFTNPITSILAFGIGLTFLGLSILLTNPIILVIKKVTNLLNKKIKSKKYKVCKNEVNVNEK